MFSLRVGRFLRVIGNGTWTLRITVPCHFQKFPRNLATTSTSTPWFVDPEDVEPPSFARRPTPHFSENDDEAVLLEIPSGVPDAIRVLHNELSTSPFLEPATLIVRKPLNIPAGPPLPERKPRGKRKRGGTYAGESQLDSSGGIWNWIVMAQVKEGTEARGSIESVVRIVRTTLLKASPPVPLPRHSKNHLHNGWAMIDAGNFSVHIMNKEVRQKYFEQAEIKVW